MDRYLRWFSMPIGMQISNIGSEVSRALRWKSKSDEKKTGEFTKKAIELLELTMQDPKNKHRTGELGYCIEELKDYFLGDNEYHTTEEMIKRYYDAFIM